jgi:hypothetical protein
VLEGVRDDGKGLPVLPARGEEMTRSAFRTRRKRSSSAMPAVPRRDDRRYRSSDGAAGAVDYFPRIKRLIVRAYESALARYPARRKLLESCPSVLRGLERDQ